MQSAMRGFLACLLMLSCLLPGAALSAAESDALPSPLALRAQMLRLAEVDWRLREAAGELCPRKASGIGVWIDHSAAYPRHESSAARVLRLGALPQVVAVATSSPAARAGIRPGDAIVAIGSLGMADALARSPEPALFAEEVMDLIAALRPGRPVSLVLQRGKTSLRKTVEPLAICESRTMLDTDHALAAYSDDRDLAITSRLIAFTANDDELALIVGHELAHVILRHEPGEPNAASRQREAQADLLGAALAQCAGYDMARAAAFWPRYRQQDASDALRLPSHPSPVQREDSIRAAIAGFTCPVSLSVAEPPPSSRHRP
jgi:beta-barrel assembly-enhancing protease